MIPNIEIKNRPGIYGIWSMTTGKVYVGKTKCMYKRCHQYIYDIRERALGHINDYLYNAIQKYGVEDFGFFPIEFAPVTRLAELELEWIQRLNSNHRDHGYNLRLDSSTGMIAAPETSEKIRANLIRQWANGERDGHSEKLKANWASDPDRRTAQSDLFSKTLTRYSYEVTSPDGAVETCNYKRLVELGLKNAIGSFHRLKRDDITHKGHQVRRITVEKT